ncbi:MAG: hypothetical protein V4436_00525, partial [Patescibacteria group bacterium]
MTFVPISNFVHVARADGPCVERNPNGDIVGRHPILGNGSCQQAAAKNTVTNEGTGEVIQGAGNTNTGIGATIGYWVAQIIYVFTVGLG